MMVVQIIEKKTAYSKSTIERIADLKVICLQYGKIVTKVRKITKPKINYLSNNDIDKTITLIPYKIQ